MSFCKRRICMFEWAGGPLFSWAQRKGDARKYTFFTSIYLDLDLRSRNRTLPDVRPMPPCPICVFFCSCRKSNFFNMLRELILTFTQRHLRQHHSVKYLCFVCCYRETGVLRRAHLCFCVSMARNKENKNASHDVHKYEHPYSICRYRVPETRNVCALRVEIVNGAKYVRSSNLIRLINPFSVHLLKIHIGLRRTRCAARYCLALRPFRLTHVFCLSPKCT